MGYRVQYRRDTAERWAEINPILLDGEIGYVKDNPNQYKMGDGVHRWNDLPLRGFDGTIAPTLGYDDNAVLSQRIVTEKFEEQNEKITELGSKVDANTFNLENVEKALMFDEPRYEEVNVCENGFENWNYGYINTNGVIVGASSGTYKYSEKIPIKKDSVITIKQIYGNTSIASLAAYTSDNEFVRECSYIGTEITTQSAPVTINTTEYNVSYIRITYGGGFSRYDVRAFEGYAASLSLHQKIETVENDYNNKIQKINSELIFDESTYEEVNVCENGFNDWDYGYIKPDGTIATTSSGTYKYSPIIEIKKDSVITIKQIYGNTSIASLAAYTDNGTFVRDCSYVGTDITIQSTPIVIDTTGYNISYIRITYGGGFNRYDVRAFVGEEKYMQIHQKIESIENDYNTKIQDVNDKLEYTEIANQWKGKTWIALGTSITDTNNTLAPDGTCTGKYVPYLMEYGEFGTVENRGVAGTIAGAHMLYYASHATNLANADLVTVEGFVNDWAGAKELGKVGDTIPYHVVWSAPVWDNGGNDEDGTFAGAVYQILTTLMTKAPKAKIILITDNTGQLIPSTGADCSREKLKNGLIQKDYTDMAISVAKYLGIEVINAGQESQINQNHPEYLIDQVHQSELGGKQFAKTIWSKLKSIQPIEVPL